MSIDAQKRLQRNTKDLFRIYGYPRNPDHFVFLFPFPSLLNIPISEIFIVFGNEHLTNCLNGVVISVELQYLKNHYLETYDWWSGSEWEELHQEEGQEEISKGRQLRLSPPLPVHFWHPGQWLLIILLLWCAWWQMWEEWLGQAAKILEAKKVGDMISNNFCTKFTSVQKLFEIMSSTTHWLPMMLEAITSDKIR